MKNKYYPISATKPLVFLDTNIFSRFREYRASESGLDVKTWSELSENQKKGRLARDVIVDSLTTKRYDIVTPFDNLVEMLMGFVKNPIQDIKRYSIEKYKLEDDDDLKMIHIFILLMDSQGEITWQQRAITPRPSYQLRWDLFLFISSGSKYYEITPKHLMSEIFDILYGDKSHKKRQKESIFSKLDKYCRLCEGEVFSRQEQNIINDVKSLFTYFMIGEGVYVTYDSDFFKPSPDGSYDEKHKALRERIFSITGFYNFKIVNLIEFTPNN